MGGVSRERSVPRQLTGTARSRSLSSGVFPPGMGWDPLRSLERSSGGFVVFRTKPPGKRRGRGRGRPRGGLSLVYHIPSFDDQFCRLECSWIKSGPSTEGGQTPSVVLGDFNVIRTIEEKSGGGSPPRGMREFG
ncbi:hypothetical protein Dimus_013500 [Dionaea muscipula]